jgi:hypothetical protein
MVNESLKKDFWLESFDLNSISDSLPSILDLNSEQTELVRLSANKNPIPKLGYNFHVNTLLIRSLNDSTSRIWELTANLLAPSTNTKINPAWGGIGRYKDLMPKYTYEHLSGAGFISLNAVASAAISLVNSKKQKPSIATRFSEFEKEYISEKTNQMIWEIFYENYSDVESDSIKYHNFLGKDSIVRSREYRIPPYY